MINKNNYNNLLLGGVLAIVFGIALLCYSVKSYSEIKYLNTHIDFDELDNNNRMPTTDKYYKYLSIGDFLNQKLEKNKRLPIKNTSCAYLDYAQHNILSLYSLMYKKANDDNSRKSVVEGNIRSHLIMLENYKTCRKYPLYKAELQSKIEEIEKTDSLLIESRMDAFLNGSKTINNEQISSPQYNNELESSGENINQQEYINNQIPQQSNVNIENNSVTEANNQYEQQKNDKLINPYLQ